MRNALYAWFAVTPLAAAVALGACGDSTSADDGANAVGDSSTLVDDSQTTDAAASDGGGSHDGDAPETGPSACTEVGDGYGPNGTTPLTVDVVTDGLEIPWGLAFLSTNDILISERAGRVRRVTNGVLSPTPVLSLSVDGYEAGGLLDLVLDPDFAATRAFYVYANVLADSSHHSQVQKYTLSLDGTSATWVQTLVDVVRFHNGGRLKFGPDGMLYVGTGDDHERLLAQDPTSLQGKILRLKPDGSVPTDNPWAASPVYLIGLRNPQAFDWLDDGSMVVMDNGPSGEIGRTGHDEVNVVPKGSAGANLGWPAIYGCESALDGGLRTPLLTWTDAVPPSGGSIYRGDAIPAWKGNLLLTTLRSTHLHRVVFDDASPRGIASHEVYFGGATGYGRLRGGITGPDGAFYVVTGNCDVLGSCTQSDRLLRIHAPL